MSDRRDQQLHFRVSKAELERIRNKMEASGQIYTADLEDLRARLDELISVSKQILAKLTEL